MRLEEKYLKNTVVLGAGNPLKEDELDEVWGSAFLIGWISPAVTYLVTAAHVVSNKTDAPLDVRFNRKGGGAGNYRVDPQAWVFHETDETVDVAVHCIEVPDWADVTILPVSPTIVDDGIKVSKNIGPRSRTFTVGLWKFMKGTRRNQPFVYTGHIGLIPEGERIPVRPWLPSHGKRVEVEAYLVEGEPLDGVSGAPVFVRRTLDRTYGKTQVHLEGSTWLLGIQSDAFFGEPGEGYEFLAGTTHNKVPRGVNVVVPSTKIAAVLNHSKLEAERRTLLEGQSQPSQ